MIRVTKAKKESRARDRKRRRVVLHIDGKKWHLTRKEAIRVAFRLLDVAYLICLEERAVGKPPKGWVPGFNPRRMV